MYNYRDAVMNDLRSFMRENYTEDELLAMTADDIESIAMQEDAITGYIYGYDYEEVISEYVRDNLLSALMLIAIYEHDLKEYLIDIPNQTILYKKLDTFLRLNEIFGCATEFYEELHEKE